MARPPFSPLGLFLYQGRNRSRKHHQARTIIVADFELDLLDELRVNGSVIPLQDLIKDACDNVVHFSDYKAQQLVETEIYEFSQYIKDNLGDD